MCGINAIVDFKSCFPHKKALVSGMNSQMIYRGPDGEGLYADSNVALGMRRLSIIDVEGGNQPLFNEDGSLVLVCNGEIYNYVELRKDLAGRGHTFTSGSDVETILHLYEEKGEACLDEIRGMFAFVLWDTRRRRIFAARDRVGIKPLYMSQQAGTLWLSSELKTIVKAAGISPTIRPSSVYENLMYSYPMDQRHTPIEEVTRLLPGEYLIADASGITLNRYWKPQYGGEEGILDRSDEEIFETLESAVQLHLRSDVPVGILLSGGIDSSALAALAGRSSSNHSVLAAGYAGRHAVDERRQAQLTAKSLRMNYIDIECSVESFGEDFDQLIRFCDEPVGDIAAMAQWALYQQSKRQDFKVLISGIGGDELFFGYPRWNGLGNLLGTLPGDATRHASLIAGEFAASLGPQTHHIMAGTLAAAKAEALLPFCQLLEQVPRGPDEISAVLCGGYLVNNGCQLADKLGMGSSVEVRVPFLDHVLMEQILALPLARRFEIGKTKPLLRRLMRGLLPDSLLNTPKKGFTPPVGFIDEMVNAQTDVILDGHLARSGWLDVNVLETIITRGESLPWLRSAPIRRRLGIGQSGWLLFRLLAFEKWCETLGVK